MEPGLNTFLAAMLGGALGGAARAWLCSRIKGLPGTLLVNVIGGFALGYLAGQVAPDTMFWSLGAAGVLGGFTTVSAFALQSVETWRRGAHVQAMANVSGSVLLALGAVALGLWVGAR